VKEDGGGACTPLGVTAVAMTGGAWRLSFGVV